MKDDCVFCKIVKGELPRDLLLENENFVVFRCVPPRTEGHVLVVPKKHCDNFMSLSAELYSGLLATVKEAVDKIGCKDFNLVVNNGKNAGQVIEHFHLHILPRKEGDGPLEGGRLVLA